MAAAPFVRAAGTEAPSIAGSIAPASQLQELVDAWLRNLVARKRKPKSIDACRQIVGLMMREKGLQIPSQVTAEAVTGWMDLHSARWKGTTYNRNLTLIKSFTRYLARNGYLAKDPLDGADRAFEEGGEGSRAATSAEARSMIRWAWMRGTIDRRSKGNRALYWMFLYAHGCRAGEPEQLRWKHVRLDEPIPFVDWTADIQKNRRRMVVPLTGELADLVRRHRETVPHADDEKVFPIVPPRVTFRHDRDEAGIPAIDHRGRRFSPHSARKFFETELINAGIQERMVDRLMRHFSGVAMRYFDPGLKEMADALAKLPPLWPERFVDNRWIKLSDADFGVEDLTKRGDLADHGSCDIGSQAEERSIEDPAAAPPCRCHSPRAASAGPSADSDAGNRAGPLTGLAAFVSSLNLQPQEVPRGGCKGVDRSELVADLLDVLARILRKEHQDGATSGGNTRTGYAPDQRGTDGRGRRA